MTVKITIDTADVASISMVDAITVQVAVAAGRAVPSEADIHFAEEKAIEWNRIRAEMGLPLWE